MHLSTELYNVAKLEVHGTEVRDATYIEVSTAGHRDSIFLFLHSTDPRISRLLRAFADGIDQLNMRPGSEDDYREIHEREVEEDPIVSSGINARIAG